MSIESEVYLDLARIWNLGPGEVEKMVRDYIGAVTCDFEPLKLYSKPRIHIEPIKIKSLRERLEEIKMKNDIYPLVVVLDRYNGTYSGGKWTAWNLNYVPSKIDADDMECADFFSKNTIVYGRGETPQEAIDDLKMILNCGIPDPGEEDEDEQDSHKYTRADILDQAKKCVCGQREQDYGTPESNFQLIADLWNDYLGITDYVLELQERIMDLKDKGVDVNVNVPDPSPILSVDVAMMMALLKIARIRNGGGSGDSFVDLAGYAACGGEIWAR